MHLVINFWKCTKNIFAVAAIVFHFLMKKALCYPNSQTTQTTQYFQ